MIPSQLLPLANHLWQTTLFAAAAGLLTLLLRKNSARVRFWLWLSASLKFLIPFSILADAGGLLGRHTAAAVAAPPGQVSAAGFTRAVEQVGEPFITTAAQLAMPAYASYASVIVAVLIAVWAVGSMTLVCRWTARWRRMRASVRAASPMSLPIGLPVKSSPEFGEPGVFGILRPALLLPDRLVDCLTAREMDAIVAHELCHIRRLDNLTTAVHMAVESLFWFHPLVWWLGARLVEERERACDEEVLRAGGDPSAYAAGILKVCELYLASPLACVAGVAGGDLKRRIEAIVSNRAAVKLNYARKAVLTVAAMTAVALPIAMGIVNAPFARAQSGPGEKRLTFEAASVKPASVPADVRLLEDGRVGVRKGSGIRIPPNTGGPGTDDPGRIHYPLITLKQLLRRAWDSYYEIDGPSWLDSLAVAVEATMPQDATKAQFQEMLRNLIIDRFGMQYHAGKKEIAAYALMIARNGPKLKASADQSEAELGRPQRPAVRDKDGFPIYPPFAGKQMITLSVADRSRIISQQEPIEELARVLARQLRTIVTDATGLTAKYDFTLTYASLEPLPAPADAPKDLEPAPDIFAALESQLGLKLEHKAAPVEVLVIDHIEKNPTGN